MFYTPPLEAIIDEMLQSTDDKTRTLGWNLFHDKRVSPERFDGFTDYLSSISFSITCPASMKDAVSKYHASRVRSRKLPDFLVEPLNQTNFHSRSHSLPAVYGNRRLVRVLKLSHLGKVYQAAKVAGIRSLTDYLETKVLSDGTTATIDIHGWLDRKLGSFSDPSGCFDVTRLSKHSFLSSLLEFMNLYRRQGEPYQPVWATGWAEFSSRDWQKPGRWLQMLGVQPSPSPSWLLLLAYDAREAGQIVRPTQLDCGWDPAHFPTPASATSAHPMDLDDCQRERFPLPEFIHQQMDHFPTHMVACARVPGTHQPPLPPPQRRHYKILADHYSDVPTWVQRHHPAFPATPTTTTIP